MGEQFGFSEIKRQIQNYPASVEWNQHAIDQALADGRIKRAEHTELTMLLARLTAGKDELSKITALKKLELLNSRDFKDFGIRFLNVDEYEKLMREKIIERKKEFINMSDDTTFKEFNDNSAHSFLKTLDELEEDIRKRTGWGYSGFQVQYLQKLIYMITYRLRPQILELRKQGVPREEIRKRAIEYLQGFVMVPGYKDGGEIFHWDDLYQLTIDRNTIQYAEFTDEELRTLHQEARDLLMSFFGEERGGEVVRIFDTHIQAFEESTERRGMGPDGSLLPLCEEIKTEIWRASLDFLSTSRKVETGIWTSFEYDPEGAKREKTFNNMWKDEGVCRKVCDMYEKRERTMNWVRNLAGVENIIILKQFKDDPGRIFDDGFLSKLLRACSRSEGRMSLGCEQYQCILYVDAHCLSDYMTGGGLGYALRKFDVKDVVLGVRSILLDQRLIDKLVAISSTAGELSHPVFGIKGEVRWPR